MHIRFGCANDGLFLVCHKIGPGGDDDEEDAEEEMRALASKSKRGVAGAADAKKSMHFINKTTKNHLKKGLRGYSKKYFFLSFFCFCLLPAHALPPTHDGTLHTHIQYETLLSCA